MSHINELCLGLDAHLYGIQITGLDRSTDDECRQQRDPETGNSCIPHHVAVVQAQNGPGHAPLLRRSGSGNASRQLRDSCRRCRDVHPIRQATAERHDVPGSLERQLARVGSVRGIDAAVIEIERQLDTGVLS
jgi:hypothetical protein